MMEGMMFLKRIIQDIGVHFDHGGTLSRIIRFGSGGQEYIFDDALASLSGW